MKTITAYSAGRVNGNCETFAKAALMAAEKKGVKVELIRLNSLNLKPCIGCPTMPCGMKGPQYCVQKDDGEWLINKFLDSDGYLLAAPVWSLGPTNLVTVFRDRVFGPKMDSAMYKMMGHTPDWFGNRLKERPGALISVGGAITENWTSLGLPTLYTTTFSAQTDVVDQMNVTEVADPGAAVLRDDLIARAELLGEHLADAVLKMDTEKPHWMGDDTETACPNCHQNLIIMHPGTDDCECAVCGRFGKVKMEEGKVRFIWPAHDDNDRLLPEGKLKHGREIMMVKKTMYEPHKEEIPAKMKKYQEYTSCLVMPPHQDETE